VNQLERARDAVRRIASLGARVEDCRKELEAVLGEAQNGPPDGAADGTIGADAFTSLRALERQASYFASSLAGAAKV
jgi:hypothetical protein